MLHTGKSTLTSRELEQRRRSLAKAFSVCAALATSVVGVAVLIGWALDLSVLKSILPNWIAMKPNTALCFLLLGVGLLSADRRRGVAEMLGASAALIGSLTLIEYFSGRHIGIDQLLFRENPGAVGTYILGRMAPNTAVSFLASGCALVFLDARTRLRIHPSVLMAAPALFMGMLAVIGYAYGVTEFSGFAGHTHMALPTAVTFVIFGAGIVCARPERGIVAVATSPGPGAVVLRRMLPFTLAAALVLGWFLSQAARVGLYETHDAMAVFAVVLMVVLASLATSTALALQRIDDNRARAEEALSESDRRSKLLSDVAGELLMTGDPQGLAQSLCERVMDFLDCHAFFNFLVDEQRGCLHLNAFAGISEEESEKIEWLDYGAAVCGCAARDGVRIVAEDIFNNPDPRTDLVKGYGIQAYACHPLLAEGGRVIGTLSFGSKSKTTFNDDEISLMKAVADQVATAMERIRLLNAQRQRAEELQAVLDAATETVWLLDVQGRILAANAAGARRVGLSITEAHGKRYYDVLPSVVAGSRKRQIEEVVRTGSPAHFEDESGGLVLEHSVFPVRDAAGRVTGVSIFSHDITDRKQAEQRERELEAHKREFYQRTILAATSGKLFITDRSEIERIAGAILASWDFSDAADVSEIRLAAAEMVESAGVAGNRLHGFVSYAGEAISNAVKYAHGGEASVRRRNGTIYFMVTDKGPGIAALNLPDVALVDGYTTSGTLGMGYKLMMSSMDKVYLATGPDGTTVAGELRLS